MNEWYNKWQNHARKRLLALFCRGKTNGGYSHTYITLISYLSSTIYDIVIYSFLYIKI